MILTRATGFLTLCVVLFVQFPSGPVLGQSVWNGSAGVGPDRWNRPGNWNNFLPPVTPLQDAVFGDIAGTTNVRVAAFGGGSATVLPDDLRFTNVLDDYTITIPNGSSLRPISITLNGSGNVTFTSLGTGTFHAQIGSAWEMEITGTGNSLFTVNSVISNGALPTRLIHDREAGTTVLNGVNTYSGGTELRGGLLVLGDNEALGTGDLEIFGGILSNDGTAHDVAVPVFMLGNFTVRDTGAGDGVFFLDAFDLDSGDLEITLSGTSGLVCFEGVLSGAADRLTFSLEAGTTDFLASLCGLDANTFAGLVIVDDGVVLELNKDPGAVAIAGDLEIRSGGTVVTIGGGQFANTSNLEINGELLLALLPFDVSEQVAYISGNGSIFAGLADAALSVDSGDFSGEISDGTDGGQLGLTKSSNDTLVLSGANTYSGGTMIQSGTVRTENASALGTGEVTLASGTLDPVGQLDIDSLTWNGGTVASSLGTATDIVNISGNLTLGGGGGGFVFTDETGFAANTDYTIMSSANMEDFLLALFSGNPLLGLNPIFSRTGNDLIVSFSGSSSGPLLQNVGGPWTPTTADFVVNGPVRTGDPAANNRVNSLLFNPSSSLQVFNNLTITSGNFTVQGGSASLFGGNVIAPRDFNKLGLGTLITNTNFQVGGAANIRAGGLIVNGQLTAPGRLTVFQNALLGGSGIINANVFNNGTVAPGNSPGTLTINGNFSQSSSGTLQIEIASPSVFDRLVVSGNANLAGTLQVLNLGKRLKYGQQYAFLQAGSISGEFDQILMPNPSRFRGRFLTNGGLGSLLVAPTSYTLVAETPNQRRVAKALYSYIPARGNDRETVSTALDLQSEEQYPAAFDAIAPSFLESIANISIEQAFAQTQLLNQRMSSVRLGARAFQAIGLEPEPLIHDKDGKSVADPKDFKSQISDLKSPAWAIWAQGNGMFAKVTNVSQVPNYRFNSGGFLFGADYTFGGDSRASSGNRKSKIISQQSSISSLSLGVFAGYQGTYADYNSAGRTSINSALFGGYASYTKGGFYADAVVAGGYNNYNVRRSIEFSTIDRSARSTQNGGQFSAAANLGYDWEIGKFTLGPIAGLQYTYVGIAPFTESGADSLNLRVGQQNANSMRSTLGGRIAYTWNLTESIVFIPEVRIFWLHEFLNNPRVIGSALDGGSGESFGYLTSTPDRDSVFVGAGLTTQFGPNWYASAFWNIDFGRQDFLSHIISLNLGMKF